LKGALNLTQELRAEMIGVTGMSTKDVKVSYKETGKATIIDVATVAKVSPGTVSRVFNNAPNVDEANRQRVLAAAEHLGYIHVPKRRVLEPSKEGQQIGLKSIVFALRDLPPIKPAPSRQQNAPEEPEILGGLYFSLIFQGAMAEATRHKLNVVSTLVEDSLQGASSLQKLREQGQMDGLLLAGFKSQELFNQALNFGVPVVALDNYWRDLPLDAVTVNYSEGTMRAIEHLVELGHRDIVYLTGKLDGYATFSRLNGYRLSLIELGLPYRPELLFESNMTVAGGERVARELLKSNLKFTAICCSNDADAIGVIRTLLKAGKRVPEDISVTGFDDLDAAKLISPPLSTIHASIEALGSIGVERLLARAADPSTPIRHTMLPTYLVVRNSTARVS
jgi:LacI family transcriptional regulator